MINFSLHLSGPRIRLLIALANGEYRQNGASVSVGHMERDGLVAFKTVNSDVEGVTLSMLEITEKGQTVVGLVRADVVQYLSRIGSSKRR
jgi:hypothetical protein